MSCVGLAPGSSSSSEHGGEESVISMSTQGCRGTSGSKEPATASLACSRRRRRVSGVRDTTALASYSLVCHFIAWIARVTHDMVQLRRKLPSLHLLLEQVNEIQVLGVLCLLDGTRAGSFALALRRSCHTPTAESPTLLTLFHGANDVLRVGVHFEQCLGIRAQLTGADDGLQDAAEVSICAASALFDAHSP